MYWDVLKPHMGFGMAPFTTSLHTLQEHPKQPLALQTRGLCWLPNSHEGTERKQVQVTHYSSRSENCFPGYNWITVKHDLTQWIMYQKNLVNLSQAKLPDSSFCENPGSNSVLYSAEICSFKPLNLDKVS